MYNISWTNTVADVGSYGAWPTGGGPERNCSDFRPASPKLRLEACWGKTGIFKANVLAGANNIRGQKASWPDGNFITDDQQSIGYIKLNNGLDGDYHLAPSSKFKGKATDGKDPGADVDAVLQATQGLR
jgi:hypothetical protein